MDRRLSSIGCSSLNVSLSQDQDRDQDSRVPRPRLRGSRPSLVKTISRDQDSSLENSKSASYYKPLVGISPNLQLRCSWGEDELMRFWDQEIKGQGHRQTTYNLPLREAFSRRSSDALTYFNETYHSYSLPCPHDIDTIFKVMGSQTFSKNALFRWSHVDGQCNIEDHLVWDASHHFVIIYIFSLCCVHVCSVIWTEALSRHSDPVRLPEYVIVFKC